MLSRILLNLFIAVVCITAHADTPEDKVFRNGVRVVLRKHCTSCHNQADKKGGINLDNYDFVVHVIRRGELFRKVVETVESGNMPPQNRPAMSKADKDSLIIGINRILNNALAQPDPGQSVMRRLSHREYSYTVEDLLGVSFNAKSFFPSEGSGGGGFDNQASFMSPLLMERYYEAADSVVNLVQQDVENWRTLVNRPYKAGIGRKILANLYRLVGKEMPVWKAPMEAARQSIIPFATKAYRRFLDKEEEDNLLNFFKTEYFTNWKQAEAFNIAVAGVMKSILISPHFLYRFEANPPLDRPYAVSNFELATRLSYLLWSSMPDKQLLNTAYRENLHSPTVLAREAKRMMEDEKFDRFAASFAPQWLGIEEILYAPNKDPDKFPEFTEALCEAMHQEVVGFFREVFDKDLLQLLDSDFTWINEDLARHYSIDGVEGKAFRKVPVEGINRGGVLGMGAVLTATSLPLRTSPVLRGQWVMDQLLDEQVPPPPADVPPLEDASSSDVSELDLRSLLEIHRDDAACKGCHVKMDALGLGLENYDAIGRWRQHYDTIAIDATGELADGRTFTNPQELKSILLDDKKAFARAFSKRLLSYALGRRIEFIDTPTLEQLEKELLTNDFNGEKLILALVNSYPFKHRRSDLADRYKDI